MSWGTFPHKKWNPFIQLDLHEGIFLNGPIPVPGLAWHIAAGVLAYPFIGMGTNNHNGGKLFADGMEVVSRGHEPARLIIPHWNLFIFTPGQPNIKIPLLIFGSSSTCEFAVGSVQGADGPIAVSVFEYVGINLACADPCSMPTCITANWGSVVLGFTLGDLVASLLCMAFDVLVSLAIHYIEKAIDKLAPLIAKKFPKGLLKGQLQYVLNQIKNILGALGLPKIFRGEKGRFASMSKELAKEIAQQVGEFLFGMDIPGTDQSGEGLTSDWFTGPQGKAEQLGAWIDGRSEHLP